MKLCAKFGGGKWRAVWPLFLLTMCYTETARTSRERRKRRQQSDCPIHSQWWVRKWKGSNSSGLKSERGRKCTHSRLFPQRRSVCFGLSLSLLMTIKSTKFTDIIIVIISSWTSKNKNELSALKMLLPWQKHTEWKSAHWINTEQWAKCVHFYWAKCKRPFNFQTFTFASKSFLFNPAWTL